MGISFLFFPPSKAVTVEEYAKETNSEAIDLFVLDGTWREAKSIYYNCKFLHSMRKVGCTMLSSFYINLSCNCNTFLVPNNLIQYIIY